MSNLAIWLVGVLGVMVVATIVLWATRVTVSQFSAFGQGLGGFAAAAGIVLGGALFIAEGRTQPRLLLQVTSTVIPTAPAPEPRRFVYVQVVTSIENQGQISPAIVECAAFDAFGIAPAQSRDATHANDLALQSLLRGEADHGSAWDACLAREAEESGVGFVRPVSGYRWAPFDIRPGQIKTRNFELIVPCTLSGVRILVKIPDPAGGVLERKMAISIVDVCRGDSTRDVTVVADTGASAVSRSSDAGGQPGAQQAPAAEVSDQGNTA